MVPDGNDDDHKHKHKHNSPKMIKHNHDSSDTKHTDKDKPSSPKRINHGLVIDTNTHSHSHSHTNSNTNSNSNSRSPKGGMTSKSPKNALPIFGQGSVTTTAPITITNTTINTSQLLRQSQQQKGSLEESPTY